MTKRYKAFISYAHSDERWAGWLQRSLETYRLPRSLRQSPEASGGSPARLFPIFLDRSELASSTNLTESIRSALDNSAALIVVCSPAAAKSRWVNEEIRYFKESCSAQNIFCLIVDGSPELHSPDCAFPEAITRAKDGTLLSEPLAADLRSHGDGKRGAQLKIAAGLLGVGVDDLMQRDAQRRLRTRSFLTAASMSIAAIMLAFAISAQIAREESELRRKQAELLIDFMLGSFRERLEPIGKLDILDDVGDQATQYFQALGDRGTPQEVLSRVLALRQIGEVRFRQGRLSQAQESFEESRDLASRLSSGSPEHEDYLFELGQAEFWVGYVALERADITLAFESSRNYLQHSLALYDMAPDNTSYQAEVSYGYSNLGTLSKYEGKTAEALLYFQQSLELSKRLVTREPENIGFQIDLGNGYSWIAAAHLQLGELQKCEAAYQQSVRVLGSLHETGESPLYWENLAQNYYHLGNVQAHRGRLDAAADKFNKAARLLDAMVAHDPGNAIWLSDQAINSYHIAELALLQGDTVVAEKLLLQAEENLSGLLDVNSEDLRSLEYLALTERSLAVVQSDYARHELAYRRITTVFENADKAIPRSTLNVAIISRSYGKALWQQGEHDDARQVWQQALDRLQATTVENPTHFALQAGLMLHLDRQGSADPLLSQLSAMGYRDPRYLSQAVKAAPD